MQLYLPPLPAAPPPRRRRCLRDAGRPRRHACRICGRGGSAGRSGDLGPHM